MPNPVKELVENGGQFAREHHADFLIAVGGGSAIDAAKAIAVCAKNEKICGHLYMMEPEVKWMEAV